MPSWKKILQSGSAVHVLNITASSLPNLSQPNIIGYDTASGRFTYFSTSSLGSGGSIIGGSGTTNYITRWSSSTLITTSSIYESGSRIGIGTGAVLPNAVLHISGASNDNLLRVSSPTDQNILLVSGSGNVGIGTTTPTTTLDVAGSIKATGFVASANVFTNVVRGYLTASFGATGIDFPTTAVVHISGASNDNLLRVSSPTDQNILLVSGSGNVGIGTTSSLARLHVNPTSTPNLITSLFTIGQSDNDFKAGFANGAGSTTGSEHAKVGMWYNPTVNSTANPVTHIGFIRGNSGDGSGITFNINNTETMRISGSNVGIGTTTPTNTLQVGGTGISTTNLTASSLPNLSQPNIIGYDTTSGRFTYFSTASLTSSFVGGSGTTNYITRWSGPNTITTSSMYESSSRIGIGTGAVLPNAVLHISGANNSGLLEIDSVANNNILFVTGSGRVGIGTGIPNATLQIAGTLNNGSDSTPSGIYSHTEGHQTTASGSYSHTEGALTIAVGYASHAEGFSTNASGLYSHAEGWGTIARGDVSHAEGLNTLASGLYSHAEGFSTNAGEGAAHAEGWGTITSASFQHVQGQNNRPTQKQSAFIIGNGSTNNNAARKNLVEINPTDNISDFFGPVRITKTAETFTQDPDILRDQNKAGIIYMGFEFLFNTSSRGPSPPIAVKINNTATGGTNYGTLRHPFTDGAASAINPAYALLKIDNAQYSSPSPSLGIGRTSNPFNVINTGIFTDGAVTAQEFRALGSWAISQTSDIRLKKNIENLDINTALRLVENVKPVTFNWNRPDTNDAFDRINGSFDVGVIAQDVLKNGFDHLVRTAKNEKMPEHIGEDGEISEKGYEFSVSYVGMIPYHAKVIKYLLDEVKELKSEIERLRKNGNT